MSAVGLVRVRVSLLSVGLCLWCVPGQVTGQTEHPHPEHDAAATFIWVTAGIGATNGMAFTLAGSLQRRRNVFSVRMADTYEGGVVDVGLLYGRATSAGPIHLSLSGGLAPVFGWRVGTTVGIPLEAQATLRKGMFGLGAYGFANVNSQESMLGVTIAVQLGRLPRQ